jgi:hypothetical protein
VCGALGGWMVYEAGWQNKAAKRHISVVFKIVSVWTAPR